MGRVSKYPEELRDRAVRMVAEVRPQYPSQWAAIDRRPQAHTNSLVVVDYRPRSTCRRLAEPARPA
jgi:hypothetical protein